MNMKRSFRNVNKNTHAIGPLFSMHATEQIHQF